MKKRLLLIGSVLVAIGIAVVGIGYYASTVQLRVTPTKAEGYFSSFGENISGDSLVERTKVSFNDEQMAEGNATSTYSLNKVANESFTGDSTSYVDLAESHLEPGAEAVYNASSDNLVPSSEYTMNYSAGSIKVGSTWDTESLLITYNWMDKKLGTRMVKVKFEIDDNTRGGTLEFSWAGNSLASDNTVIKDASIKSYEENEVVQDISESKLQNEDDVNVVPLSEGEYYIYFELDHQNFLPNANSGTYEEGVDIDFNLNSDAEDEPVEVEDYTIFTKTFQGTKRQEKK